jgi:hypothetical protein
MMGNKKVLLTASSIIITIVTQNPGATQFSDLVITASTPLTRGALPTELRQGESGWLHQNPLHPRGTHGTFYINDEQR